MFKKIGTLVIGIAVVLTLSACTETSAAEIYVAVDINPSIEFIVDEDDIITSFNLVNDDALILCADVDFIGMNIEEAVELFINLATEAGYIDIETEDNAVLFTVLGGDDEALREQLQEKIRVRAFRYFARNFINAEIFTEDFAQADLLLQAEELGITPGKLKLILLAQGYDETLTIEVGMETPVKDLVAQVRASQKVVMEDLTDEEKAELVQQRQELINNYSTKLQTHLNQKTALTDDEIDAIVNRVENTIRNTTREEWQEASQTWKDAMQERIQSKTNKSEATE